MKQISENIKNDLDKYVGLEISEKLASMLSEELSKSIDKQIIQSLVNSYIPRNEKRRNSIDKIFNI